MLGSITGGTDIVSLFAGHNSNTPIFRGEIQSRCLGMSVEAWNEQGKSVFDNPGDLVCTSNEFLDLTWFNSLKSHFHVCQSLFGMMIKMKSIRQPTFHDLRMYGIMVITYQ